MNNGTLPKNLAFWIVMSIGADTTLRSIGLADEADDLEMKLNLLVTLWSREFGEDFVNELERLNALNKQCAEMVEASQCLN